MKKKGISPLIATVLLIGFTIVLAALVMQWGGGLFNKIKTDTGTSSEVNIICSSKLTGLDVTNAKYTLGASKIEITVDNSNEQAIAGFLFRFHKNDGTVISKMTTDLSTTTPLIVATVPANGTMDLGAFDVKLYVLTNMVSGNVLTGLTKGIGNDYGKLGVMAIVTTSDGTQHTCTNEKLVSILPPVA